MKFSTLMLSTVALAALYSPAMAETVRPQIGKYLVQAEKDLQARKFSAALHVLDEASAVGGLSPYEAQVTAQLRGSAAEGAGEYQLAAQSYQQALAGQGKAQSLALTQAIADAYAQAGDQAQTVLWVHRYVQAGGTDKNIRALAAQADYAQGQYQAVLADMRADQAAGPVPLAEQQLAVSAAEKTGDKDAYFAALQGILQTAPSPAYWNAAFTLVQSAPGFSDNLTEQAEALRAATGTLTGPGAIEDYAERAILAGQPKAAQQALQAGFASGVLTARTDAGHAQRLLTLATAKALAPAPVPSAPLDAGIAALQSGQGAQAARYFAGVPGFARAGLSDPRAALARLGWLAARHPAAG